MERKRSKLKKKKKTGENKNRLKKSEKQTRKNKGVKIGENGKTELNVEKVQMKKWRKRLQRRENNITHGAKNRKGER